MTEAEILKALECCMQDDAPLEVACYHCPIKQDRPNCVRKLLSDSLDLINRQKAEIERLTDCMKANGELAKAVIKELKTAKSEARKEFAILLKHLISKDLYHSGSNVYRKIDNLLKEMESE